MANGAKPIVLNEFDIIQRYFAPPQKIRPEVNLSIGDDCAIVSIPTHHQLVITTDTLVSGVHFPNDATAYSIGYRALAVNISDIAAMGATPAWATLALTLPQADEIWLQEFAHGFFDLANQFNIQLIGGDTTHGSLTITVQMHGLVPTGKALLRSGAKVGDLIYVTNSLGDSGLALAFLQKQLMLTNQDQECALKRFYQPEPRVIIGEHLRDIATAAIDVSDGLAADLKHILKASNVGATVYIDQLPISNLVRQHVSPEKALNLALTAGEDFELCFTAPRDAIEKLKHIANITHCAITPIGEIQKGNELQLLYQDGKTYHGSTQGYRHF